MSGSSSKSFINNPFRCADKLSDDQVAPILMYSSEIWDSKIRWILRKIIYIVLQELYISKSHHGRNIIPYLTPTSVLRKT